MCIFAAGQLHLWLRAIGGQSVIRTITSWMSVWAAPMPCWSRVKGTIDNCDMLIRGWIEEKIPLWGHEGTPHGSLFRGGCQFNSRTSADEPPSKRKEMVLWGAFVSEPLSWVSHHEAVWKEAILCGRLLSQGTCLCQRWWKKPHLSDWHNARLQNLPFTKCWEHLFVLINESAHLNAHFFDLIAGTKQTFYEMNDPWLIDTTSCPLQKWRGHEATWGFIVFLKE